MLSFTTIREHFAAVNVPLDPYMLPMLQSTAIDMAVGMGVSAEVALATMIISLYGGEQ